MDKNIETITQQAQTYYGLTPAILLGSGASMAFGLPGMWDLGQYLIEHIATDNFSPEDNASWERFKEKLQSGQDLETTLHEVQVSERITNKIVESTWACITPYDLKVFFNALNDPDFFALGTLLRHMLNSTQTRLDIITTNYDRIAEYACEQEGIHHFTGFTHGYRRSQGSSCDLNPKRQVNIWKVHGSLDWFRNNQDAIIGLPNIYEIPDGFQPIIVTPGIEKYQATHYEPYRSIIQSADNVFIGKNSYLCVGFGFNDRHIQEKLVEQCVRSDSRLTIITRNLTDGAKELIQNGRVRNFLAFERGEHDQETVVHSSELPSPINMHGTSWTLSGFMNLII